MVGKLWVWVNPLGLIVNWDCATTSGYDGSRFQHIVDKMRSEQNT